MFIKNELSKQVINDLINIIGGTSKSGKLVNIMTFLFKGISINQIKPDLLDSLVNLFVMLYLKSNQTLKTALLDDLENVFLLIKQSETKIFIDKTFKYTILLYCINQFKHCQKEHESREKEQNQSIPICEILGIASNKDKKSSKH